MPLQEKVNQPHALAPLVRIRIDDVPDVLPDILLGVPRLRRLRGPIQVQRFRVVQRRGFPPVRWRTPQLVDQPIDFLAGARDAFRCRPRTLFSCTGFRSSQDDPATVESNGLDAANRITTREFASADFGFHGHVLVIPSRDTSRHLRSAAELDHDGRLGSANGSGASVWCRPVLSVEVRISAAVT